MPDPAYKLRKGAAYVARVESGAAGVKDLAGNAISADDAWRFRIRK